MRQMGADQKRLLVSQHQQAAPVVAPPLRQSRTGPATDDFGTLARRFSLIPTAWSSSTVLDHPISTSTLDRPATFPMDTHLPTPSDTPLLDGSSPSTPYSPNFASAPVQSASSWTSWWSHSTGIGQNVTGESKDTPSFYVDQLRSRFVNSGVLPCNTRLLISFAQP